MTSIVDIAIGVFAGELALSALAFGINTLRARAIIKAKADQMTALTEYLGMQQAEAEAER